VEQSAQSRPATSWAKEIFPESLSQILKKEKHKQCETAMAVVTTIVGRWDACDHNDLRGEQFRANRVQHPGIFPDGTHWNGT